MHLLGHHLPEHKLVRVALLSFHGIGESMAKRLLARLQIPEAATVSSLTEPQVTALSAYLSSPTTSTRPSITPIAAPGTAPSLSADAKGKMPQVTTKAFGAGGRDPLQTLKIETDLRRDTLGNVQHHRNIGTYRGRRHAMGLPVRGQGTRTNARTARKRNFLLRIKDSKGFSTFSTATFNAPVPQPPSQILRMLGMQ